MSNGSTVVPSPCFDSERAATRATLPCGLRTTAGVHWEALTGTIATVSARTCEFICCGRSVRMWVAAALEDLVDRTVLLREEVTPEPPYWAHLWPAAATLARVVAESERIGGGVCVAELGCGLGLPALWAATRGAFVVASDWKREPLEFVRASARLNGCTVALVQMDWRAPALRGRFDVCLGADIAYDLALESTLARVVARLLRPGGIAWLADSVNVHRCGLTDRLREEGLAVQTSWRQEEDEGRRVWVRLLEASFAGGDHAG